MATKECTFRSNIYPGLRVKIVLKKDQPTGALTEGVVERVLTNSPSHWRGIKVMLTTGQVGRVQEIIKENKQEEKIYYARPRSDDGGGV